MSNTAVFIAVVSASSAFEYVGNMYNCFFDCCCLSEMASNRPMLTNNLLKDHGNLFLNFRQAPRNCANDLMRCNNECLI